MIIIDVETTGVDPKNNSIVSIGAIDFSNPKNQFYEECFIYEGAEISDEALKVNGFTKEQIKDKKKKSLKEIMTQFMKWVNRIEDRTLAGENPSFDRDFLRHSCERSNIPWTLGHRTVDLHSISYAHHKSNKHEVPIKNNRTDLNSDKIMKYVGIPEEPKPHNALNGAKFEAEAFSRLIYGKTLIKEFESYPVPEYCMIKSKY